MWRALPYIKYAMPRPIRSPENIEAVRTSVLQSPQHSARCAQSCLCPWNFRSFSGTNPSWGTSFPSLQDGDCAGTYRTWFHFSKECGNSKGRGMFSRRTLWRLQDRSSYCFKVFRLSNGPRHSSSSSFCTASSPERIYPCNDWFPVRNRAARGYIEMNSKEALCCNKRLLFRKVRFDGEHALPLLQRMRATELISKKTWRWDLTNETTPTLIPLLQLNYQVF